MTKTNERQVTFLTIASIEFHYLIELLLYHLQLLLFLLYQIHRVDLWCMLGKRMDPKQNPVEPPSYSAMAQFPDHSCFILLSITQKTQEFNDFASQTKIFKSFQWKFLIQCIKRLFRSRSQICPVILLSIFWHKTQLPSHLLEHVTFLIGSQTEIDSIFLSFWQKDIILPYKIFPNTLLSDQIKLIER